ncbi:MAG: glycosyltransferase [Pseudomonadota bacterium]
MRGLKYISFHEKSGYGISGSRYFKGLAKSQKIDLTWTPLVVGPGLGYGYEPYSGENLEIENMLGFCNKRINYDTVIVHTVPEYFPIIKKYEAGKKIIGYTVWETDKIPQSWYKLLQIPDLIFVPSEFTARVFKNCKINKPIEVIPHIIGQYDMDTDDTFEDLYQIPKNKFLFYSIGTWTFRKAIYDLIESYLQTFTKDDPVTLLIKTSDKDFTVHPRLQNIFTVKKAVKKIQKKYKNPAQIILIDKEIPDEHISSLHKRGDCFISLARSEGFGMCPFEAANYANPVIMTAWGGQCDYLDSNLSYLVDYKLSQVIDKRAKKIYSRDQKWAVADRNHASYLLKEVYENFNEAKIKAKELQNIIRKSYNETIITEKILCSLEKI